jgi:3-hydroxybutyrate dehydrogenase
MTDLRERTALVTGATGGLGQTIAGALAKAGCRLLVHGIEEAARSEDFCRRLEQQHGTTTVYCSADLAKVNQLTALVEIANTRLGGVDILINNAVVRHFAPIEAFCAGWWDEALAVNLSAAFHLIRLAVPGMRARGFGRIINLTSVYGMRAVANRVDYVTTKTALVGLTRAVAVETLGQGITCNAVCPGAVLTPYSDGKIRELMRSQKLSRQEASAKFLHGKQPTGRFIAVEGVADLIIFLCGASAGDITGAVLPVDAGWTAS